MSEKRGALHTHRSRLRPRLRTPPTPRNRKRSCFMTAIGDELEDHAVTAPPSSTTTPLHHLRDSTVSPSISALFDPHAQRLRMDTQLTGDPSDRALGSLRVPAGLHSHPRSPLPQLRGVLPRCTHDSDPSVRSLPPSNPGRNSLIERRNHDPKKAF